MKGRDRNQLCPCGSGKKWKKCNPIHWNLDINFIPPILRKDESIEPYINEYLKKKAEYYFNQ